MVSGMVFQLLLMFTKLTSVLNVASQPYLWIRAAVIGNVSEAKNELEQ